MTRSYSSEPVIRATISSEVPATLFSTMQPVSSSNWVTQSNAGIGLAPLDVAGPGDDDDAPLTFTDLGGQVGTVRRHLSRYRQPPARRSPLSGKSTFVISFEDFLLWDVVPGPGQGRGLLVRADLSRALLEGSARTLDPGQPDLSTNLTLGIVVFSCRVLAGDLDHRATDVDSVPGVHAQVDGLGHGPVDRCPPFEDWAGWLLDS